MRYTVAVKLELWRTVDVEAENETQAQQYARNAARYAVWDGGGHGSAFATVTRTDVGSVRVCDPQRAP
jgi:hypothetical protein